MRYLLLLAAGAAAVFAAGSFAAGQRAQVAVAQKSPVVVTGAGFKAHERVVLTVSSKSMRTKRIVAGPRGGFRITFRGFSIPYCMQYTVRAKGNRGSSVVSTVIPECPAARRAATTTGLA